MYFLDTHNGPTPAARAIMAAQDLYCRLRYRKLWKAAGL